jgi:hypothetical protein
MRAIIRTRAGHRVSWVDTGIRYPNPSTMRLLQERRKNPGWRYQEIPEADVARMTTAPKKEAADAR